MPQGKSLTGFFFLLHFIQTCRIVSLPFIFHCSFEQPLILNQVSLRSLSCHTHTFFLTHYFPWTYHNSKLHFFLLFKNNAISQVRLPNSVRARTILFVHWCSFSIQGTWQCCWNVEVKSSFETFLGLGSKGILSISYFTILVIIKTLYTLK